MPQLDIISFHYLINSLGFSYLCVYVITLLFLLRPIFRECFFLYKYPSSVFLESMLLVPLYSEKVMFSIRPKRAPDLSAIKSIVRKQWDWLKYTPRIKD